ncbi:MAG: crotonobetainyl-CoA--carnitine CoA-transferase, partial [Verrucomicrobia bacterium]
MIFSNGVASQTITIPVLEDTLVEGDEYFTVGLLVTNSGQAGSAQILSPSNAVVTIIDNDAGLRFSAPAYTISEAGVFATITVLRTNVTTNTVTVDFATTNGTAIAGVHYFPVSGTLIFTNGVTAQSFTIQVIDETIIEGDHTVL